MCTSADWIIAIASVGMFWVGWNNYKLYKQSQEQAKQHKKDFEDLLEAIVISNIISGPSSTGGLEAAIVAFKTKYKGERQIFKELEK